MAMTKEERRLYMIEYRKKDKYKERNKAYSKKEKYINYQKEYQKKYQKTYKRKLPNLTQQYYCAR